MKLVRIAATLGALACAPIGGAMSARAAPLAPVAQPIIVIEDVARFYQLYDAAGGHPSAEQLQRDDIDPGSEGLHHLARCATSPAPRSPQLWRSSRISIQTPSAAWRCRRACASASAPR